MPTKFNASVSKLQHEMWKNKLITFLNGGPVPTATTHRECALGKWLYDEGGLEEYGTLPEMRQLEQYHAQFHSNIKKVIDSQQTGDKDGAWSSYEALKPMSIKLQDIIDAFGAKVK
jgi:hypothetical protein